MFHYGYYFKHINIEINIYPTTSSNTGSDQASDGYFIYLA